MQVADFFLPQITQIYTEKAVPICVICGIFDFEWMLIIFPRSLIALVLFQ